jgi:hypothetical protein
MDVTIRDDVNFMMDAFTAEMWHHINTAANSSGVGFIHAGKCVQSRLYVEFELNGSSVYFINKIVALGIVPDTLQ